MFGKETPVKTSYKKKFPSSKSLKGPESAFTSFCGSQSNNSAPDSKCFKFVFHILCVYKYREREAERRGGEEEREGKGRRVREERTAIDIDSEGSFYS